MLLPIPFEGAFVPAHFDEIVIGQVVSLGVAAVDVKALESFRAAFAPSWGRSAGCVIRRRGSSCAAA